MNVQKYIIDMAREMVNSRLEHGTPRHLAFYLGQKLLRLKYEEVKQRSINYGLIRSEPTLPAPTQCSKCGHIHVITRGIGGLASGARKP